MSIFKNSRYENSKVYFIDDSYYIAARKLILKKEYDDNIIHIVKDNERIEIIADIYWKRPDLYYIICDWNNIMDPLEDLKTGMELVLPSYKKILEGSLWTT
jgi:hypothetical protein